MPPVAPAPNCERRLVCVPCCGVPAEPNCAGVARSGQRRRADPARRRLRRAADAHAIDQGLQIGRIILAADFGANQILVRVILVAVDGVAHFAQVVAQFRFFAVLDGDCETGESRPRKEPAEFRWSGSVRSESVPPMLFLRWRAGNEVGRGIVNWPLDLLNSDGGFAGDHLDRPLLGILRVHLHDGKLRIARQRAPLTTMPTSVPEPLTPGVFGMRVAEMMACPRSLSTRSTMATSCVPPERNPPWRTSSMEITAGLNCSSIGMEYRSCTFCTVTPIVVVSPGFRAAVPVQIAGSRSAKPAGFAGAGATAAVAGAGCATCGAAWHLVGLRQEHRIFQPHFGVGVGSRSDAAQVFGRDRRQPHDVRNQDDQDFVLFVIDRVAGKEVFQEGKLCQAGDSSGRVRVGLLDQPAEHVDFAVLQANVMLDAALADDRLVDPANVCVTRSATKPPRSPSC